MVYYYWQKDFKGERNTNARLTAGDVRLIKFDKKLLRMSDQKVATMFGVTPQHIRNIRSGKRWRHITTP